MTTADRRGGQRVLQVICRTCGDTPRVVSMSVTKLDEVIVPRVGHALVISLDEQAATALFDLLGEWLG